MKNFIKMTSLHLQKMGSGIRIATIVALCLTLTAPLFAQNGNRANKKSVLTIESWDDRAFVIEIENKRYRTDGSITLKNLTPGKKRVRVFRRSTNTNSSYRNRGRGVVLYTGFIDVPRHSRVRARITKNRRMKVLNVRRLGNQSRPNQQVSPHHGNRPHGNSRPNGNNRPSSGSCSAGYDQYEYEDEVIHYEDAHGFEPYSYEQTSHYGGACAMESVLFEDLLLEIEDARFSEDKMRVARQALRHNYITVKQLESMMCLFSFDNSKLSVAKMAYENVIDKENTWKLYDAFSFSSTAREFEEFVDNCG